VTPAQKASGAPDHDKKPLRLTVFGANGGSGRALMRQALAAGHQVTAVTRHPEQITDSHEGLTVLRGDATDAADVQTAVKDADAVLSALGVPYSRGPITLYSASARQIVDTMQRVESRRLIVVTSSAVNPDAHPDGGLLGSLVIGPLISRLGRTMYDDMRRMEEIVQDSDLDWTILRPPALFDKDAVGRTEISLEPLGGNFAARQDLAAAMLTEVGATEHLQKVLYIRSLEGRPSIWRTIWRDAIRKKR
jgi:putative NADH-flavin reductase